MFLQKALLIALLFMALYQVTAMEERLTHRHKHKHHLKRKDGKDNKKTDCEKSNQCMKKTTWKHFEASNKDESDKVSEAQKECKEHCEKAVSYKDCAEPKDACDSVCDKLDSADAIKEHKKERCLCEIKDGKTDCNNPVKDGASSLSVLTGLTICGLSLLLTSL
eukprot:Platyproteum_vivax@DN1627_c0_g1_i1.p1